MFLEKISELRKKFPNKPLLALLVTDHFSGRTTAFAIFFSISATGLAWFGKLTDSYAAVITALQALILAKSLGDDYHERNKDSTTNP